MGEKLNYWLAFTGTLWDNQPLILINRWKKKHTERQFHLAKLWCPHTCICTPAHTCTHAHIHLKQAGLIWISNVWFRHWSCGWAHATGRVGNQWGIMLLIQQWGVESQHPQKPLIVKRKRTYAEDSIVDMQRTTLLTPFPKSKDGVNNDKGWCT